MFFYKNIYLPNKNTENKTFLKNIQKTICDKIYFETKNQKDKEFSSCKGNINKIWKIAKQTFFKNKENFPDKMVFGNEIICGSKKIANKLNQYFIEKVKNKIQSIPLLQIDPLTNYKKKYIYPKIK